MICQCWQLRLQQFAIETQLGVVKHPVAVELYRKSTSVANQKYHNVLLTSWDCRELKFTLDGP